MLRAVIDTTHHTGDVPLDTVVAGLTLLERSLRLAGVIGCETAEVVTAKRDLDRVTALIESTASKLTQIDVVSEASEATEPRVHLRSSTVYNRGMLNDAIKAYNGESLGIRSHGEVQAWIGVSPPHTWFDDDRFLFPLTAQADAQAAAHALWQDCRKPLDGMVARHLNRYISLTISRGIANLPISPNHISIFTFSLGILAGLLCAMGGYWNFLLAGIVFQANSIIDGCDGELARVKYEFSLTGEWLDTLSDDFSDVFFWSGLAWGAYITFPAPFGLQPWVWLILGAVSVLGKLVSMGLYYQWLIANKRGDLLAFTWSFDDETKDGAMANLLKNLKYLTKKDFIVFACMILGFVGLLPYMLVAAAPGNLVVALSVISQQRANSRAT